MVYFTKQSETTKRGDKLEFQVGDTIKKLRKNKGYSQEYLSTDILSQSTYSKFELNKIDIGYTSYISILERIEVSNEEVLYIMNDYSYTPKASLLNKFFKVDYNQTKLLESLIQDADTILRIKDDVLIADVKRICEALIVLSKTGSLEKARTYVKKVWYRLSKQDSWYLTEIKLINTILFLFNDETAIKITENVFRHLKKYDGFQDVHKYEYVFKINLSLLLMRSENYRAALDMLESTIFVCKKHSAYKQLSICYARKGICLKHLGLEEYDQYIDKACKMLEVLEEVQLKESILKEIEFYG